MTSKESLINKIVGDLENDLDPEQLRKVNMLLLMHLDSFDLVKTSSDMVIYDERSDAAAYQQFMVSKKIQGLSDGTLKLYMQTINFFMRIVRKSFKDVSTNDIRLYIANREIHDRISKGTLARERGCIVRFFTGFTLRNISSVILGHELRI